MFIAKYATGFVSVLALAGSFGLPAWFGYAYANNLDISFYLRSIAGLIALLLVGYSAVSLLLLVAMKKLPGRKMKQLFIISTAILGILCVLGSQILSSKMARTEDPSMILKQFAQSGLSSTWYLPSTWMTNAVLGSVPEFGVDPGPYWSALIVSAVGLTALAVYSSDLLFLEGWAGRNTEIGASKIKKSRAGVQQYRRSPFSSLRGTYWTVLRKDLTLLLRDPLIWYNLVVGVIVLGFFLFNISGQPGPGRPGDQNIVMGTMLLMMSTLMGSITGAQTGGISLSREGSAFWLIRSNPVDPSRLFWAKATYALVPSAILVVLFLGVAAAIDLPRLPLWLGALLGLSMVSVVGIAQILLDVYFPDFTMRVEFGSTKSGRGSGKLLVSMFISMGIVFFMFAVIMIPGILSEKAALSLPAETVYRMSFATIVAMGILAWTLGSYLGTRQVSRLLRDM